MAEPHMIWWRGSIISLHILALIITVVRISDRLHKKRMWWDDYFAFIPLILDPLLLVAFWQSNEDASSVQKNVLSGFFFVPYYTNLWISRIMLSLALARIFPSWSRTHKIAIFLALIFLVLYISNLVATSVACKVPGKPLYKSTNDDCRRGLNGVSIGGLISNIGDIAADIVLVVFPIIALRKIKLPVHQRRLILTAASASSFTLIFTVPFCTLWYGPYYTGPRIVNITAIVVFHLEDILCLIVANLLVIVTLVYRIMRKYRRDIRNIRSVTPLVQAGPSNKEEQKTQTKAQSQPSNTHPTDNYRVTRTGDSTNVTLTELDLSAEDERDLEYLEVDSRWADDWESR